jgi:Tfp pilus assembly protein PilF
MRLKQRDFESARPLLELAVELQPGAPQARLQLAKLNGMTGKYAEAACDAGRSGEERPRLA